MTTRCRLCRRVLPNGGFVCLPACPKPKPYEAPAVAVVGRAFCQAAPVPQAPRRPSPKTVTVTPAVRPRARRATPETPAICRCGAVLDLPFLVNGVELVTLQCHECGDNGTRQPRSESAWWAVLAAEAEIRAGKKGAAKGAAA